ncbi:hypothetical protein M6B38_393980 [Iris pallida]|uniref:Uncharacterized protein n=1 Tax=Iris pallida TaxID=29817 RepID=A0AAX6FXJ0_IRIPA|nr:hypothetical protein M6B38_393980 [Iris pallida]
MCVHASDSHRDRELLYFLLLFFYSLFIPTVWSPPGQGEAATCRAICLWNILANIFTI